MPTPRPEEKPPKPQIIDYQDFTKEHLKISPNRALLHRAQTSVRIRSTCPSGYPRSPSATSLGHNSRASRYLRSLITALAYARIDAAWVKPAQLAGVRLLAEVVFDVSSSGRITNERLRRGSGNKAFDQSILTAFRNASSAGLTPTGQPHRIYPTVPHGAVGRHS